jgi:hypothetical protein
MSKKEINERNKEFEKLKSENEIIRDEIDKLIGLEHPLYSPIWVKINELVENELQQEEMCNQ